MTEEQLDFVIKSKKFYFFESKKNYEMEKYLDKCSAMNDKGLIIANLSEDIVNLYLDMIIERIQKELKFSYETIYLICISYANEYLEGLEKKIINEVKKLKSFDDSDFESLNFGPQKNILIPNFYLINEEPEGYFRALNDDAVNFMIQYFSSEDNDVYSELKRYTDRLAQKFIEEGLIEETLEDSSEKGENSLSQSEEKAKDNNSDIIPVIRSTEIVITPIENTGLIEVTVAEGIDEISKENSDIIPVIRSTEIVGTPISHSHEEMENLVESNKTLDLESPSCSITGISSELIED
jgi:hypothetical protein